MDGRQLISSGSPYEPTVGYSRAVRVADRVVVAGTAPQWPDGTVDPDPAAAGPPLLRDHRRGAGGRRARRSPTSCAAACTWSTPPTSRRSPGCTARCSATSARPTPPSWWRPCSTRSGRSRSRSRPSSAPTRRPVATVAGPLDLLEALARQEVVITPTLPPPRGVHAARAADRAVARRPGRRGGGRRRRWRDGRAARSGRRLLPLARRGARRRPGAASACSASGGGGRTTSTSARSTCWRRPTSPPAAGAERFVTGGHSFGGAIAVRAGMAMGDWTKGVVTFATQSAGCEEAGGLTAPLLAFHGDRDELLPLVASQVVCRARRWTGRGRRVRGRRPPAHRGGRPPAGRGAGVDPASGSLRVDVDAGRARAARPRRPSAAITRSYSAQSSCWPPPAARVDRAAAGRQVARARRRRSGRRARSSSTGPRRRPTPTRPATAAWRSGSGGGGRA